MVICTRILSPRIWHRLQATQTLTKEPRKFLASAANVSQKKTEENVPSESNDINDIIKRDSGDPVETYRFIYPEFLPDPNPEHRNAIRERLERMDMMARRSQISIPEFYVGSILAVTYTEPHAPSKVNRFVGICIERKGCGLRAIFRLRNVVDGQGVEVTYELYDPTIQKIQCLKLEKRLDPHLRYLRDAPPEYSTIPFDMEPEFLPEGAPVPVNKIQVPLKPLPWVEKWERQELKGITNVVLTQNRKRRAEAAKTPWVKYDLMRTYRETIPEEEQSAIFAELKTELQKLELNKLRSKRKQNVDSAKQRK